MGRGAPEFGYSAPRSPAPRRLGERSRSGRCNAVITSGTEARSPLGCTVCLPPSPFHSRSASLDPAVPVQHTVSGA